MDGRYEEPEDQSRRMCQLRHFPLPVAARCARARGTAEPDLQSSPATGRRPPADCLQGRLQQKRREVAVRAAQPFSGAVGGRAGGGVRGPAEGEVLADEASGRPAARGEPGFGDEVLKTTPAEGSCTLGAPLHQPVAAEAQDDGDEELRRLIGRDFQPTDPPWPALTQSKRAFDRDAGCEKAPNRALEEQPRIPRSRAPAVCDKYATTYASNFDPPSAYARERTAGRWDHERYHKGERETKGHEHGWNKYNILGGPLLPGPLVLQCETSAAFLAPSYDGLTRVEHVVHTERPGPTKDPETTYADHFAHTHQLGKTMFSPSNPPVWKRRHHAMFPRPSREFWGR